MSEIVERILTAIDKGKAIVKPCARREVEAIRVAMNSGELASVGRRMNVLTMSHKVTLATPQPAKAKNQPQPKMRGR